MTKDIIQDFSELYRAAYAERDHARKLALLKEVQRRIRLSDEATYCLGQSQGRRATFAKESVGSRNVGKAA